MSPRKALPLELRLIRGMRVDANGCWIWQRSTLKAGYGCIRVEGKTRTVHSVAFELFEGEVPEGLELDHLCRVRACCNPMHLEPVTHRENILRGASRAAKAAVTHCPRGHAYDASNTYRYQGRRFCRACQRAAGRAYKQRMRERGAAA